MAMLQCQVDFASITLRADGPGCRVILRGDRVNAVPDPTIRPDWCMTDALLLDCAADGEVRIELDITPAQGWQIEPENGEHLRAYTFRSGTGDRAAIGIRDMEWVQETTGMRLVDGTSGTDSLRATFQTEIAVAFDLEIALATIRQPAGDAEALSPWLAVDRLMKI